MKTSFGVDIQLNKSFFNLVLRCHADNRGFGKVVCPCIDKPWGEFNLQKDWKGEKNIIPTILGYGNGDERKLVVIKVYFNNFRCSSFSRTLI